MKTIRIIYYLASALLSVIMLMSAGMYLFNYPEISKGFAALGFPIYIIYPLAILKLSGVAVLWINTYKALKEWAYAGFVFVCLLAVSAHINASDNDLTAALAGLILAFISYFCWKKTNRPEK